MKTLPYWIEHGENNNPINYVWIKVPRIPANSITKIYIQKKKGFYPDGDKAFELFDDFDNEVIDSSKWNIEYTSANFTATEVGTTLALTSPGSVIGSITVKSFKTFANNFEFHSRLKFLNDEHYHDIGFGTGTYSGTEYWHGSMDTGYQICVQTPVSGKDNYDIYWQKKTSSSGAVIKYFQGTWASLDVWYYLVAYYSAVGELYYAYIDETNTIKNSLSAVDTTYLSLDKQIALHQGGYSAFASGSHVFDWVFVKKYTSNEPSVSVSHRGLYYEVEITNNETYELTDYQVAIPVSDLNIQSPNESLYITPVLEDSKTKTVLISGISGVLTTKSTSPDVESSVLNILKIHQEVKNQKSLQQNAEAEIKNAEVISTKQNILDEISQIKSRNINILGSLQKEIASKVSAVSNLQASIEKNISTISEILKQLIQNISEYIQNTMQLSCEVSDAVNIQDVLQKAMSQEIDISNVSTKKTSTLEELKQQLIKNLGIVIEDVRNVSKDISALTEVSDLTIIKQYASTLIEEAREITQNYLLDIETIQEITKDISILIDTANKVEQLISAIDDVVLNVKAKLETLNKLTAVSVLKTSTSTELKQNIQQSISTLVELVEDLQALIERFRTSADVLQKFKATLDRLYAMFRTTKG